MSKITYLGVEHVKNKQQQKSASLARWLCHVTIFGDVTVQFPEDDVGVIEAIFAEASVSLPQFADPGPMLGLVKLIIA